MRVGFYGIAWSGHSHRAFRSHHGDVRQANERERQGCFPLLQVRSDSFNRARQGRAHDRSSIYRGEER